MAGIGFELRKLMKRESFISLLHAYAYAGVISSGPWILSIIAVLSIGILAVSKVVPAEKIQHFQSAVTYLIASSLIFTGLIQLAFTRYCADRIFEKEHFRLLPNLNGVLFLVMLSGGGVAFPLSFVLFHQTSIIFRLLFATSFVVLSCVWIATILLSGLKAYKAILINFAAGYGSAFLLSLPLRHYGLEGLMLSFTLGQFILLMGMLFVLFRNYPARTFVEFDFLNQERVHWSLAFSGFFYNLGLWVDKFVFWFHPATGEVSLAPLQFSVVYDLPVFLAYLSIIPGMAVFLVRMETDFVEYYEKFYDAVREGGSLSHIEEMKDEMVVMARDGIYDIIKIQAIATIFVYLLGPKLLSSLGIDLVYFPLLLIQVVGAGFQVVFLGLLNIYYYLDRRVKVLFLTVEFTALNLVLSYFSIQAGPFFYGYGFAVSLCICIATAMLMLDRDFRRIEYETFMLQE